MVGLSEPPIFKYSHISTKLSGIYLYTLTNINDQLFDNFLEKCHNEVKKPNLSGAIRATKF